MKSAKDVAELSREAQSERARQEQQEEEKEEQERTARERLHQAHLHFERRAVAVAKDGGSSIAIADLTLDPKVLQAQGFQVKQLTRRESYQTYLASRASEASLDLSRQAHWLASECPGLEPVGGDNLLSRNPLISFMESQWQNGGLTTPVSTEVFISLLREHTAVGPDWLTHNNLKLGAVVRAFEEVKLATAKLQSVSSDNDLIPPGVNNATYVSWHNGDHAVATTEEFSAHYLASLSRTWREVSTFLSSAIERDAARGAFSSVFNIDFHFDSRSWSILDAKACSACCSPAVLQRELRTLGYQTSIEFITYDDDFNVATREPAPASRITSPLEGDAFQLRISWC